MKRVKRILLYVLSVFMLMGCCFVTACGQEVPPPGPVIDEFEGLRNIEGLVPTFRDEFTGNELDLNKWQYEVRGNWYNNELQYYDEGGVTVSFGSLKIQAVKNTKTFDKNGVETSDPEKINFSRHYGSSRIRSYERFSQMYGRFEARIRLPAQRAMWPAFWMLSENNTYGNWPFSGEIDIMEAKGRIPETIGNAIHFAGASGGATYVNNRYTFPDDGTIEDFHTYTVDWEQDKMTWYVDGVEMFTVKKSQWEKTIVSSEEKPFAPFDQKFHMLLNLAVGGNYDKDNGVNVTPADDFVSAVMEVDWVRVWQFEKYLEQPAQE